MVGTTTIRYNNGVRSNSGTPEVAGGEQERAILRCLSVGTVGTRLQKRGGECSGNGWHKYIRQIYSISV